MSQNKSLAFYLCTYSVWHASFHNYQSTLFTFNMDKYKSSDRVKHQWLSINKNSFYCRCAMSISFVSVQRGIIARSILKIDNVKLKVLETLLKAKGR